MNHLRVKAIVKKDLMEVLANKMVVIPMMVLPLLLCVLLPGGITYLDLKLDFTTINGAESIVKVLPAYTIPAEFGTTAAKINYVFLNYIYIPFFMLIPIMMSSIIAANSVVGEKERKTLETLLYTPVSNEEFVLAKQLSAFLPAVAITIIGFAGYFIVVNGISLFMTGLWLVQSPIWIPAILLVSPAVSLLALGVTQIISMHAKTFMEAQQLSSVVVIPFLLIVVVQLVGLVVLSMVSVLLFGVVVAAVALFLLRRIGPRFEREAILRTL